MLDGGVEQVARFRLVLAGHDDHARNRAQVGHVEDAMVRGAIVAGQAGAVEHERDVQVLQGHVVDDLVERALQEGGVDGADRLHARRGHAGREGDRVLFGDADVVDAVREALLERAAAPVPSTMAAVMATMRSSFSASSISASAKTLE